MPKTRSAVKILDRVTGDDAPLRRAIAEDRLKLGIGDMIHAQRTAAGLTQGELAKLVGTTQSVIARLEDADYEGHSVRMLFRIAQALKGTLEIAIIPLNRQLRRPVVHRGTSKARSKARKTGTR